MPSPSPSGAALVIGFTVAVAFVSATAPLPVWNAPTSGCYECARREHRTFDPAAFGIATNPDTRFFGPVVTLFYKMGAFPLLHGDIVGTPCWVHDKAPCSWDPWRNITAVANGGVPQRANLTLHLEEVTTDVVAAIPNASYDGLVVIDWEAWRVPFKNNYDSMSLYQRYSERLVAEAHPEWAHNHTKLADVAAEEFNAAAKIFWTATVERIKALRPNAKVGFYEYPFVPEDTATLEWLWDVVDLLCPSFYASVGHDAAHDLGAAAYAFHRAVLAREQQRVKSNGTRVPLITPYVLDGVFLSEPAPTPFTSAAVNGQLLAPVVLGADAFFLWGSSASTRTCADCVIVNASLHSFGPTLQACVAAAERCATERCGGHGRCVVSNLTVAAVRPVCDFGAPSSTTCRCDAGFQEVAGAGCVPL
eukprot:CAMPEP_0174849082 /NCGR_PEP_ID=MMETSP1114-20130205/13890_1 /TAXON_ID=312471 /ORGANISM="Neobodo designis, Strain CCAP 1951/1" /LENGTH=418 /DNA_ID=CAMNT_0016083393 /DNA_START=28 /DNA_END=1284 /DNA_ORIENTATION=-